MYLEYFKLREFPFRLTPDTDFLYMSSAHSRAKAYMEYTVWNRDGFVVITGEIGSGKTTLVQKLLSELDENVLVAKIFQTQLDEVEFLQAVLVEFGLNPFKAKKVELIDMLNTFLVENFLKHSQLVLIVDDAHNLGPKVLEEIRMLSSLETNKEKLLHIILVGHSELNKMIEEPDMEQLLQRVRLRYNIRSLTETETQEYVRHRLRVAGASEPTLFADNTIPMIYKYTGGIPRLINTLCDTALVCAYADGLPEVTTAVVNAAIEELEWLPYVKRVRKRDQRQAIPGQESALRDSARALAGIGNRLAALEQSLSNLPRVSTTLTNIEALLRQINQTLQSRTEGGGIAKGKTMRSG